MRLDKYLCDCLGISRSGAKKKIESRKVYVNSVVAIKSDLKIDEDKDIVEADGKRIVYEKYVYYMLNKPSGIVSANTDGKDSTVIDLFKNEGRKNLSCVGRLDKDTTGLLLVTDDGQLIHRLTSPKKGVFKDYLVGTEKCINEEMKAKLTEGVDIGDEKPTLPAKVAVLSEKEMILSISEGRFHQVKRMLEAVENEVISLHRLSLGNVKLDETLLPGEFRRLTAEELAELKSY